jgi:hypothetical protein
MDCTGHSRGSSNAYDRVSVVGKPRDSALHYKTGHTSVKCCVWPRRMKRIASREIAYGTKINTIKNSFLSLKGKQDATDSSIVYILFHYSVLPQARSVRVATRLPYGRSENRCSIIGGIDIFLFTKPALGSTQPHI